MMNLYTIAYSGRSMYRIGRSLNSMFVYTFRFAWTRCDFPLFRRIVRYYRMGVWRVRCTYVVDLEKCDEYEYIYDIRN